MGRTTRAHAPRASARVASPNRICLSSTKQQTVARSILATIDAPFEVVRRARIRRRGVELQLRPMLVTAKPEYNVEREWNNMMHLDVSKPEGMDELKGKA